MSTQTVVNTVHGEQESLMDLSGLLYAGCIACICLVYPSHRSGKGLLYTLPDVGITGVRTRGGTVGTEQLLGETLERETSYVRRPRPAVVPGWPSWTSDS